MNWVVLSLVTALSLSTADALSKRALGASDELAIIWVREGYALPFLAIGFFFVPFPSLDGAFWLTMAALVPLELLALVLYVKAIKLSPLSLTIPFMALSPVFIVFIAFVFLGEWPARQGLYGIMLIVLGAYLLNAGASGERFLGPVRAIIREPGSMLMIAVALIYSVTSTLGKVAVQHSSPIFFGFFYPFVLTVCLTAYVAYKGKLRLVFSKPATFIPIGLCTAVMIATHFLALSLTQVAYMISVKRTNLVFSVIYGKLLFNEENIRQRLLGSLVMVAGVVLIALH